MSQEIEDSLRQRGLVVPKWDRSQAGRKQPLPFAFERRLRAILNTVAEELGQNLGPVMGHRLCGTNGNHAYGCLACAKQHRYCKVFQLHHYGETIEMKDTLRLKELLRGQEAQMRHELSLAALRPSPATCD
jgi:hypothetical protein